MHIKCADAAAAAEEKYLDTLVLNRVRVPSASSRTFGHRAAAQLGVAPQPRGPADTPVVVPYHPAGRTVELSYCGTEGCCTYGAWAWVSTVVQSTHHTTVDVRPAPSSAVWLQGVCKEKEGRKADPSVFYSPLNCLYYSCFFGAVFPRLGRFAQLELPPRIDPV